MRLVMPFAEQLPMLLSEQAFERFSVLLSVRLIELCAEQRREVLLSGFGWDTVPNSRRIRVISRVLLLRIGSAEESPHGLNYHSLLVVGQARPDREGQHFAAGRLGFGQA